MYDRKAIIILSEFVPLSRRKRQQGSALLLVMIVMGVMLLLIAVFAMDARQELLATQAYRNNTAAYELARAALAAAICEVSRMTSSTVHDESGEVFYVPPMTDQESWVADARRYRSGVRLGEGMYSYSLRPAEERIDINSVSEQMWHRIFELGCDIPEGTERTELVNAILDWIDKDDLHRIGGAEDDYYQSLSPPRHCKNNRFDTLEELLLVKGITRTMLFGEENEPLAAREDGLLVGGGISRFVIAGVQSLPTDSVSETMGFVVSGRVPADMTEEKWDEDEVRSIPRPRSLAVIARGWTPGKGGSRHALLVYVRNVGPQVVVQQWNDNAVSTAEFDVWPHGMIVE